MRSSLWDARAEPVGEAAKLPYQRRTAPDGTAQVDADALLDLTAQAIDAALGSGHEIDAVAMSTMWHCLLGLDSEGRPATPVYTWADRRAAQAAGRLRERLDEPAVHVRTGCPLHSSYWPAKVEWIHASSPEVAARVRTWVSPGEYVHRRLFGDAPVSTSMASATGLLDQHSCRWDAELASAVGAAGSLPEIDDAPLRGLTDEWARRWPSLRDVPWFPAVGDGACSNVGTGCVTQDRAALMVGTSGALRVMWAADDVPIPPGLWCYRADARRVLMGGALSDGGSVVAWLRRLTRLPSEEETESEIAAMEPDAHGLTVLPLLSGERGPGWADEASATIAGLSLATDPLQLLRASLEAVALRFALIDELLMEALPEERHVIATGGGLVASPAWTQIMADALGRPVTASAVEEGSSRGAAMLALEALGTIDSLESVEVPLGDTFEPDPRHTAAYKRALARQRELYDATIELAR